MKGRERTKICRTMAPLKVSRRMLLYSYTLTLDALGAMFLILLFFFLSIIHWLESYLCSGTYASIWVIESLRSGG